MMAGPLSKAMWPIAILEATEFQRCSKQLLQQPHDPFQHHVIFNTQHQAIMTGIGSYIRKLTSAAPQPPPTNDYDLTFTQQALLKRFFKIH